MDDIFHLKILFDKRCHIAGLFGVSESPALVAVSVHNKAVREKDKVKVVEFVKRVKTENAGAVPIKTEAQLEEERKMAEKARIASERANAFLKKK